MEKVSFAEKVYALCQQIPRGRVTTYKILALQLGIRGYRAIGQALRCNPYAPKVPCHRVVKSDGSLGGFRGKMQGGEIEEKISLLKQEGIVIQKGLVDLQRFGFFFYAVLKSS